MSAWRYCPNCGGVIDYPTIREILKGEQYCSQLCGYHRVIEATEKDMGVDEFVERIERIEKHLGIVP